MLCLGNRIFIESRDMSQQLTWSHFVELLPINEELKRDYYATMSKNENWSVRTLRERGGDSSDLPDELEYRCGLERIL